MEFWYYIIENGKSKRVSYEAYEKYEGKKYRTLDHPGLRFFCNLLPKYR